MHEIWSFDYQENHYILRLKYTKIEFGCGSAPDPAGGAYSAPPDPLAGFSGPTEGEWLRDGCWEMDAPGYNRGVRDALFAVYNVLSGLT